MNALRHLPDTLPPLAPALATATVSGRTDEWFFVKDLAVHRVHRVRRAASCLIEPELGDQVLVCEGVQPEASFILAVLTRAQPEAASLCLPGGVVLRTQGRQLAVHADDIELNGREKVGLNTVLLDIGAVAATARVAHVQSWSETIESHAVRMTLVAKTMTQEIGRLIARVRESWRKVDGLDETQVGRMRVHVEGHQQVDAGHVTMNAEGFVRIDGKKINLG